MINRRSFFSGLSALAAPAIIRTPGILMPVPFLTRRTDRDLRYLRYTVEVNETELMSWMIEELNAELMKLLTASRQTPVSFPELLGSVERAVDQAFVLS